MAESGVGRIIDNKYEILTSIGRGGMSYVWLGRDRRLDKMWAIKEFRPSTISSQGAANRQAIIDEANFIKRLDHPAIPRVVDIIDTGASIFVVMDFIDGTALNKVLRQQNAPFEQERVIEWGIQLCEVLEYLHGLEPPVVYRDMKPSNIMLRGDDTVKLIDFGISMELLPSGPSDARVIGTGGYGAPEQVDHELHKVMPVDTRADIYAIGATLYSLVTGHVPRSRKDETGKRSVDFEMRRIREWDAQLSEGLEHIIQKATQPDPADRYQTASEMRYDLEHYQELTREYRAVQKRKVDNFRRKLIGAGIAVGVGVACLMGSFAVRNSSYDTLVHEASVADTSERNVQVSEDDRGVKTRTAEASEAEGLYRQALDIDPVRIDTYNQLLALFEEDNLFTTTEARRWNELWQEHGQQIAGDSQYGKLCYDVGILYLSFYDYMDARSFDDEAAAVATGQGAVTNAKQATRWFQLALEHPESLSQDEINAATTYVTIGKFHDQVANASLKGEDSTQGYKTFWQTLEDVIITQGDDGETMVSQFKPIVQLRLYQVAFESISSSEYLAGFRRAGVDEKDVRVMLETVYARTGELRSFVDANEEAAGAIYREIMDNYETARSNIARTYGGAASRFGIVEPTETGE